MKEPNKKEVWSGYHDGVEYEIISWEDNKNKKHWCYYLYIHLGKIPQNADRWWIIPERFSLTPGGIETLNYKYYNTIVSNIDFHGGCTWYSKETTEDNLPEERIIKIGCDYSHYGDEGRVYDLQYILQDVENSIQSFKIIEPSYKYYCGTVGGNWDISEGQILENGEFISNKGKQYRIDKGWDK